MRYERLRDEKDILEIQKCIIGSVLMSPECIKEVYGVLEPHHFILPILKKTYSAILQLYTNDDPITILSVSHLIQDEENPPSWVLEMCKECLAMTFTSVQIKYHAQILIDHYKKEQYKKIMSMKQDGSVDEVIGNVINQLSLLVSNKRDTSKTISEIYLENKEKYYNPEYDPNYLYFGIQDFDILVGGLEETDLMCIGARPAVGKSAFAFNLALNVSQKTKVKFYTFEMNHKQILDRALANIGGVNLNHVRKAKYFDGKAEENAFDYAVNEVLQNENLIIEESAKTVSEIRNECKYIDGLGLIVIDYLQLMKDEPGSNPYNRTVSIGNNSRALRQLALDIHVPIVILSQLNRAVEGRAEKQPMLSDLRESGDIEQDCSVIAFLWNADENDESVKGISVAKNRQSKTGKAKMRFIGEHMKFEQIEKYYVPGKKTSVSFEQLAKDEELPFEDNINEKIDVDLRDFQNVYGIPPLNTDENRAFMNKYFNEMLASADALYRKYPDSEYLKKTLPNIMNELNKKAKENK